MTSGCSRRKTANIRLDQEIGMRLRHCPPWGFSADLLQIAQLIRLHSDFRLSYELTFCLDSRTKVGSEGLLPPRVGIMNCRGLAKRRKTKGKSHLLLEGRKAHNHE